jgi:HEAT repeat protein
MKSIIREIFRNAFQPLVLLITVILPVQGFAAPDYERIKSDLDNKDWEVRLAAVQKLNDLQDERTIELLMQVAGMRGEYWPVKIKAITMLGESANPKAVDLLLSVFNDSFNNWECPSIKSYTALALGNFTGNEKVVNSLINGIQDPELFTREASIKSLGRIGDPKAVTPLVSVLTDESAAVKLSALRALEMIGDQQALPHIQRVAESDADPLIRSEAKTVLEQFRRK